MGKIVVSALLVLGLTGCTNSESEVSAETTRSVMAALQELDSLTERAGALEAGLTLRCLEEKGFLVHPPTPKAIPDGQTRDRLTLSPTEENAVKEGYGVRPLKLDGLTQQRENGQWAQQEADYIKRYGKARYGLDGDLVEHTFENGTRVSDPTSGCLADVRKQLYDDLESYLKLSFSLSNYLQPDVNEALRSADVQRNLTQWRVCMVARGYEGFKSPSEAYEAAAREYYGRKAEPSGQVRDYDAVKKLEKKLATADAKCAKESNLNDAIAEYGRRELGKLYAQYEQDVYAFMEDQKEAIERGAKLLKAPPSSKV